MSASAIYTSVLPRAIETAALLGVGLPPLVAFEDCDLCELHPGDADALTWQEMVERFGAPDWDKDPGQPFAPGGESWLDFYERCVNVLERIAARHPGELVVLVVHGGVIEQAMKLVQGCAPGDRLRLRTENASMTEIEFGKKKRQLLRYNDRVPLPAK
jgi:probable phosphoglycerate mutase